jgi:hypothetical protein
MLLRIYVRVQAALDPDFAIAKAGGGGVSSLAKNPTVYAEAHPPEVRLVHVGRGMGPPSVVDDGPGEGEVLCNYLHAASLCFCNRLGYSFQVFGCIGVPGITEDLLVQR